MAAGSGIGDVHRGQPQLLDDVGAATGQAVHALARVDLRGVPGADARAARHLADPAMRHLRVIDVATEAGFGNVASFHRAFRRQFGRTPNAARG